MKYNELRTSAIFKQPFAQVVAQGAVFGGFGRAVRPAPLSAWIFLPRAS